jgi:hypothetical protein
MTGRGVDVEVGIGKGPAHARFASPAQTEQRHRSLALGADEVADVHLQGNGEVAQ